MKFTIMPCSEVGETNMLSVEWHTKHGKRPSTAFIVDELTKTLNLVAAEVLVVLVLKRDVTLSKGPPPRVGILFRVTFFRRFAPKLSLLPTVKPFLAFDFERLLFGAMIE